MIYQPFIEKVRRFIDLDGEHEALLRTLQGETKTFQAGDQVYLDASEQRAFYVVTSGWFYAYATLADGSVQVHDIYHPGDIIGLDHLTWGIATSSVSAASTGTLSTIETAKARRMMFRYPAISAVFYSMHMLTNVLLLDRLTAVARLSAYNSLAYFLTEAYTRRMAAEVDVEETADTDRLVMPLTQEFIADCLGLSAVHVSRQFKKLAQNGIVERIDRKTLQILDKPRLLKMSDYVDRYKNLERLTLSEKTLAQSKLASS